MAVLTDLTQFDRDEIENSIVDVAGLDRPVARKIVDSVLVPQIDVRTGAAVRRALEGAAADMDRAQQIADRSLDSVPAPDLEWYRAPEQRAVREIGQGYTDKRRMVSEWLRARALRGTR